MIYHAWLIQQNMNSEWLFPSTSRPDRPITEKQFYKVMARVGDLLGINYLGTHTMRKTGAYRVYTQSNYKPFKRSNDFNLSRFRSSQSRKYVRPNRFWIIFFI
jgi:integrase